MVCNLSHTMGLLPMLNNVQQKQLDYSNPKHSLMMAFSLNYSFSQNIDKGSI